MFNLIYFVVKEKTDQFKLVLDNTTFGQEAAIIGGAHCACACVCAHGNGKKQNGCHNAT
jgi:hypothetical protein